MKLLVVEDDPDMIGSNIESARYSGINTRKVLVLVYMLSGVMAAVAGIIMLARFNSVRVGHELDL